ncbi:MAG: endopeptidase La [Sphingobacteriales bacterium]|nr:endopeptidase La [Sphingobacteriales bacterium]
MFSMIKIQNTLKLLLDEESEMFPLVSINEEDFPEMNEFMEIPETVVLLPLRNTVLFPNIVVPVSVGRDKSLKTVKKAHDTNQLIGVITQRSAQVDDPTSKDLYTTGTLARVVKILKLPDDTHTVILQGRQRFVIKKITTLSPYIKAQIQALPEEKEEQTPEFEALMSSLKDSAVRAIELSPQIPNDITFLVRNIDKNAHLTHFICSNLNVPIEEKQKLLEINDLQQRGEKLLGLLHHEIQLLELKNKIQSRVNVEIDKQQRDYFLQQQMKTIQEELGEGASFVGELQNLRERAKQKLMPTAAREAFDKEMRKIQRMNPNMADYTVSLNYLELLLDLPWDEVSQDNLDLKRASKILEDDHYGLDKIKERILEYLAVIKLKGDLKSPILCFVGPPGVGKTSLGRSIARALGRKYVRMSLGGLHDESEVRGHRKTYIGAMPGRILQSLLRVGTSNPVFILDEIDKVGNDFRGDPSSALLEVLDPEQNSTFYDNYLELEYDLSRVMFIATANNLSTIQPALLDRMEIIQLSGYSTEEKIEIAKKHLIPEQREKHGLQPKQFKISDKALAVMIDEYTHESGVRDLERKIAPLMRHIAKLVAMYEETPSKIDVEMVHQVLDISTRMEPERYTGNNAAGVAIGLAWTASGGDILFVETNRSRGKGNLILTGNLGDVMKESATTALSFIKANSKTLGINEDIFSENDLHIHIPEGAIPKDGPSAGVTLLTALVSLLSGQPVKPYLAMSGEITLRGKVLPVGGIKEKILAAQRAGIKEVILCEENRKNVEKINPNFIKNLQFHYVKTMQEVLEIALPSKK